jgi:hypothetical protein
MSGDDRYRGARDDSAEEQSAKKRRDDDYKRFVQQATDRYPELKGILKEPR